MYFEGLFKLFGAKRRRPKVGPKSSRDTKKSVKLLVTNSLVIGVCTSDVEGGGGAISGSMYIEPELGSDAGDAAVLPIL
jgi:hypothetical protein